ncbi:hypothetical protein CBS14141_003724 [Malassezia furfur]|nr:hypothetical protein CBS14141_003724 [Malassezia furfur]
MDGLVVLGRAGRPLVVSRFRNEHSAYPLLHVDYLNSALQKARAEGNERDVPPVLVVPVAEDVLRADGAHALSDDDASSTSDSLASDLSSDEPSDEDAPDNDARNVWDEPAAPGGRAPPEGGAVLCHIRAGELRLLCPVSRQVDPLVPLSFLHRVADVLQAYLVGTDDDTSKLTEDLVLEHFDTVYQLLEEMLDADGNVLVTEPNTLRDIVLPPSWLDRLASTVGLSGKYTKNEVYLDFVEHLDAIVDPTGRPVTLELLGRLVATTWLNGAPELTVPLTKPALVQDPAWHPCVRQKKWATAQTLNFVPPDGTAELASYRLTPSLGGEARTRASLASIDTTLPLFVDVEWGNWDAARGSHAFAITVESRHGAPRTLTDVVVEWQLGDLAHGVDASVHDRGVSATAQSVSYTQDAAEDASASTPDDAVVFDRRRHLLRWTIARLRSGAATSLRGTVAAHGAPCRPLYALQVRFTVPGHSLTGLRAKEIQLGGTPTPAPAKGVRNALTGSLEWRRR